MINCCFHVKEEQIDNKTTYSENDLYHWWKFILQEPQGETYIYICIGSEIVALQQASNDHTQ